MNENFAKKLIDLRFKRVYTIGKLNFYDDEKNFYVALKNYQSD